MIIMMMMTTETMPQSTPTERDNESNEAEENNKAEERDKTRTWRMTAMMMMQTEHRDWFTSNFGRAEPTKNKIAKTIQIAFNGTPNPTDVGKCV